MRYAQLVMGPAGSGKSTYCSTLVQHAQATNRRTVNVVNLDPAAEYFDYQPLVDIRDLIKLDDAMEDEELKFGPNGGLIFCMEYLMENMDWLEKQLSGSVGEDGEDIDFGEEMIDDDYIIFDCPGQIELYTHMKMMRQFVDQLQAWNFRICGVFLIDSHFMVDGSKFLSASTAALSVMVNLEIPHVNVLSKIDLLSNSAKKQLDRFLEPDTQHLIADAHEQSSFSEKYKSLSEALAKVLDDYSLVKFFPLNINDEESIGDLFMMIDSTIQYGEDLEVQTRDFDEPEKEEEEQVNSYFD